MAFESSAHISIDNALAGFRFIRITAIRSSSGKSSVVTHVVGVSNRGDGFDAIDADADADADACDDACDDADDENENDAAATVVDEEDGNPQRCCS